MNAEHDVQRAIAGWLHETAIERAPDRVLERTAGAIDRTKQRRQAAWRVSMFSSPFKVIAAGLAVIALALGAGLVGRSTADVGDASPSPVAPSTSPAPSGTSMAMYRLERNLICAAGQLEKDPLIERYTRLYEPDATAAEKADGIAAMEQFIELGEEVQADLAKLDPPAEIADEHAANLIRSRDMIALLRHMVSLLNAGNYEDALVVDKSTDAIAADMDRFEQANALTGCP